MFKKLLCFLAFTFFINAGFACTNFLVGKAATLDGSTLISYNADSYFLFGALYYFSAANYAPGTMLDIHEKLRFF